MKAIRDLLTWDCSRYGCVFAGIGGKRCVECGEERP